MQLLKGYEEKGREAVIDSDRKKLVNDLKVIKGFLAVKKVYTSCISATKFSLTEGQRSENLFSDFRGGCRWVQKKNISRTLQKRLTTCK